MVVALFEQGRDYILPLITEKVLQAAARNSGDGGRLIALLLDRGGEQVLQKNYRERITNCGWESRLWTGGISISP